MAGLPADAVTVNFDPGEQGAVASVNDAGWPLGATEVRNLAAYDGKLFVGTGMWMDTAPAGDVMNPGCAILRLDSGNDPPVIEHSFRATDTAVCLLYSAYFKSAKQTVFIASTWNSRFSDLYVRDYGSSSWHFAQCLAESPAGGPTYQVRSAITYTDPVTKQSRLFLGQQPVGLMSLGYDADARGGLSQAVLELDTSDVPLIPVSTDARVMSFAEMSGDLYATVLNRLYKRENGANACWHCVYVDEQVGYSESGWRGLTHGGGDPGYFLVAREGSNAAILRLAPKAPGPDPGGWTVTVEYDMVKRLSEAWTAHYGAEVKAGYSIAGYNDMVWFQPPGKSHWALWVGFEAQVSKYPKDFPVKVDPEGEMAVQAALGSYLVFNFRNDGKWVLNHLPPVTAQAMVATRCGLPAPFPGGTRFYIGGHDCNKIKAHNSGFLVSLDMARMIEGAVA